jgi:thiamine phosphate synthase YjbQ (UPF0047 family)
MEEVEVGEINGECITSCNNIHFENTLLDFKYPTFDDPFIDSQLKFEIRYDTLISDITSSIDSLNLFESLFLQSFDNIKIFSEFQVHKINFTHSRAFILILKREINLLLYLLKYKFEGDDYVLKCIQEEYLIEGEPMLKKSITSDGFIIKRIEESNYNEDIISELDEIINKSENFEKELLINYSNTLIKPSITGLSILIKFITSTINKGSKDLEKLLKEEKQKLSEDLILDFFQVLIKTEIFISLIPLAFKVNESDLFNLKENSKEWIGIKSNYERIVSK